MRSGQGQLNLAQISMTLHRNKIINTCRYVIAFNVTKYIHVIHVLQLIIVYS